MAGLNKPARAGGVPLSWSEDQRPPRWYLWEGGFLIVGRAGGEVPSHAHHAIQIHVAVDGKVAIRPPGGEWRESGGVIVRADVEHSLDARGLTGAMVMVDPESAEGAWLQGTLVEDITLVPDARLKPCVLEVETFMTRPLEAKEPGELVRHVVRSFCAGSPPSRRLDPRVGTVLTAIRDSEEMKMSLEAAAKKVHLSPGRFAHLFKEEVGLPFRRYLLWRKVTRAILAMGREQTLAAAAHRGDFADAAHLTRTFHQMFGLPPSVFMRGEFFEIASPFTAA